MESSGFNLKKKSTKIVKFLNNVEATVTQLSLNDFQAF